MRDQLQSVSFVEPLLVLLIVILAMVARLYLPGITEFKADEARLLALSWEMADLETFPTRGISSSTGFPNFPASVWTYALPMFFWKHVYSATYFTAFLNILAVLLCYLFTSRTFGRTTAIVATFMFAVSPWAIIHSRKIWAQNLLPFFVMLWIMTAAQAFLQDKRRNLWLALHLLIAGFAFQIHLAAASLLVGSFILILIYIREIDFRSVITGLGLFFISAVPFLTYLVGREGGGAGGLFNVLGNLQFSSAPIFHAARLTTGWQFHSLAGLSQFETFLGRVPAIETVYIFWGILVLWGLVVLLSTFLSHASVLQARYRAGGTVDLSAPEEEEEEEAEPDQPPADNPYYTETLNASSVEAQLAAESETGESQAPESTPARSNQASTPAETEQTPQVRAHRQVLLYDQIVNDPITGGRLLLMVWIISAIFPFFIFPVSVELHYLLPLYPALYIAAGLGIHQIFKALESDQAAGRFDLNLGFGLLVIVIGLSGIYQLVSWFTMLNLVQDVATPGGIGNLLVHQLDAVDEIQLFFENSAADEVLIAGAGDNPDQHEFAAIYALHLREINHRFVDLRHSAVFPTGETIVLVDDNIRPLSNRYQAESRFASFPTTRIGDPQPVVFLLNGPPTLAENQFNPAFVLTNWVNINGYDAITNDSTLFLHWKVGDRREDQNFHIFNHLIGTDNQLVGQIDGPAFNASQWSEDDLVISRFELPTALDQSPAILRTGMYFYPSQEPVLLMDEAGN
ncbi:MAG: hypothetical protein AAF633_19345, partial [Chloroflexota bacterium]